MPIIVRIAKLAAFLALGSCLQLGTTGAGDAGPAAGSSNDAGGATNDAREAASSGTGCIVEPSSGVTLCTRVSICPEVTVDHDVYPNCGFRIPAASLEVDCVCGPFLCPLGAALTCAQMRDLLDMQSEGVACVQVSEGRCAELP